MKLDLRLSGKAADDLDRIHDDTIAAFGELQASRLHVMFVAALERLRRMPGIGRARPDLSPNDRSLRSILVHSVFLIVYEVTDSCLQIVRVLHAARDLPTELELDP